MIGKSEDVTGHLLSARRSLVQQHAELAQAIADIDRIIERFGSLDDVSPRVADAAAAEVSAAEVYDTETGSLVFSPSVSTTPPIREVILSFIDDQKTDVVGTKEIVERLTDRYSWSGASVRSALAKLESEKALERVARGQYRIRPWNPLDTEGPASAGPSGSVTTHSEDGGETTHARTGSRDHGIYSEQQDRDHDRGASVREDAFIL